MYAYCFDKETGGIILTDDETNFSKEPRPVYAAELDFLGVDEYWRYDKQNETPYMWAESNVYWYRGEIVFRVKGGELYRKPEVIPETVEVADADGSDAPTRREVLPLKKRLKPIDLAKTIEKNAAILNGLEQITLKRIFNVYKKYVNKLDCFHVAFSGGKDSVVLLDLVKRALPKTSFIVVFGDTGMEFPDTYAVVDATEAECQRLEIPFYRAQSHWTPDESWRLFGPPSRVLRWCCSVHKAAPQTLKIREILGRHDYVGLDFVGVRGHESLRRSQYEYECFGVKQRGQRSHNPILNWSSAEVWLYIFAHCLIVNEAYKKGNSRAGCLFCPMSSGKSNCFRNLSYPQELKKYTDVVREKIVDPKIDSYIENGGWRERKNGRDIAQNESRYFDRIEGDFLVVELVEPLSDWREWFKTLKEPSFNYVVEETENGFLFKLPKKFDKTPEVKAFKEVLHKAAYCLGCKVCEANCRFGCISFENGLHIGDDCNQCGQCRSIDDGCLLFHSIQLSKNTENNYMETNAGEKKPFSLNSFGDHAPKPDWLSSFFDEKDEFLKENSLGPMQISMFRRFLYDAKLIDKVKNKAMFSEFAELICSVGWESESAWGLILVNLANHNPQIRWYVRNLPVGRSIFREELETLLQESEVSVKDSKSIVKAFKRLCETPLGTKINFGSVEESGSDSRSQIVSLCRGKSTLSDQRVVLYSLYKYAEACGVYQFELSRLLDASPDAATSGIGPGLLFGFDRDDLEPTLRGLSANYNDFIDATFTHGLDKISLREDKTSADVLTLF